jgi:hypothetical protein
MDADFGTLVDFLRGELDSTEAAVVRARLENEDALFQRFERLRRTYAVLRSMPAVRPAAESGPLEESIPLTQPRAEFVRDVRQEFEARGFASLIPRITATAQYLAALRVEFSVRAICAALPRLVVGQSLLQALRGEFAARARVDSLPFIKARPAWIAALRKEFSVRAVVAGIPLLAPRPEFVAALRAEFKQRALVASVPAVDVRAGFERRMKVALVEASRETTEVAVPTVALPAVEASDPFRRRLFKKILFSSRRRVRETPQRVDISEFQVGRQMALGFKDSRRSIAFTFTLHSVAIVVMLFVFVKNDAASYNPLIARGEYSANVVPALPQGSDEFRPGGSSEPMQLPAVRTGDWSSADEEPALGVGGDNLPDPEWRTQDEPPPPEPRVGREEVLAMLDKENTSSFFRLRGTSRQQKVAYLGSEELYEALDKSLAWLARQQQLNPDNDGSWGWVNVDPRLVPRVQDLRDVQQLEMTCAAVLAFLGDGHSSQKSPIPAYSLAVERGIAWILEQQAKNADGQIGPESTGNVLVHAMGTLALAEEFGLTRRNDLREPLRKACRWLCAVKASDSAGFPFLLDEPASMSTSVWAYMALATARNVQVPPIDLPKERIEEFMDWYKDQTRETLALSDVGPVLGTELLADSAAAAMAQFSVLEVGDDLAERTHQYTAKISRQPPNMTPPGPGDKPRDNGDVRYLFFGSIAQAINLQRKGTKSNEWNNAFVDTLLKNQKADGAWASTGSYNNLYGDVFAVAMAGLSIENAYRVSIMK